MVLAAVRLVQVPKPAPRGYRFLAATQSVVDWHARLLKTV
jgi:hypothetical protein